MEQWIPSWAADVLLTCSRHRDVAHVFFLKKKMNGETKIE